MLTQRAARRARAGRGTHEVAERVKRAQRLSAAAQSAPDVAGLRHRRRLLRRVDSKSPSSMHGCRSFDCPCLELKRWNCRPHSQPRLLRGGGPAWPCCAGRSELASPLAEPPRPNTCRCHERLEHRPRGARSAVSGVDERRVFAFQQRPREDWPTSSASQVGRPRPCRSRRRRRGTGSRSRRQTRRPRRQQ